ncbi:hypothetical protein [unidentified bacterial endosymbiont]|uniref:hypothetical protein n=1 Tax=unidentified bacterial endosymbiont TaxID=2355 RepID=UPI0020A165DE|nr:hypothetical protein [unidentified bacterial endosymbiont]
MDKIDQKVLQVKEKDDKHNAAVALERSRDFQRRHYAVESIDYRLDCLSQAISSSNEALAVGSLALTTDSDSDSSIRSLSSAGKKQRTPHVAP